MPLSPGSDRATISQNISEMVHSGYPQRQAVAASLSNARRHPHADGGPITPPERPLDVLVRDRESGHINAPDTLRVNTNNRAFPYLHQQVAARAAGGIARPPVHFSHRWGRNDPNLPDTRDEDIGAGAGDERVPDGPEEAPPYDPRVTGVTTRGRPIAHASGGSAYPPRREGYAFGGMPNVPFFVRSEARGEDSPTAGGVIQSEVPGRTDHLPMSPATGSYVLPADVVSGLGEGNTLAGAAVIDRMLDTSPYGIKPPRIHHGHTIPHPPAPYRPEQAKGGAVDDESPPGTVPIVAAGGEYIIKPEIVAFHPKLGNGHIKHAANNPGHYRAALKRGHNILDAWVKHVRAQHIDTLKKLPGPAKS